MKTTLIKTSIWEEDTFFNLNLDSKLLFMYLISTPSKGISSVMKFNKRIAVAYTGLSSDQIDICMRQLESSKMLEVYKDDEPSVYIKLNDKSYVSPKKGRFTESSLKRELLDIPENVLEYFGIQERADAELIDAIKGFRYQMKLKGFRSNVFENKGSECSVCGEDDYDRLTIDHIVPLSLGGNNDLDNLQVLCSSCNSRKGMESSRSYPEHKDKDNNKDISIANTNDDNTNLVEAEIVKYGAEDERLTDLLYDLMHTNSPDIPRKKSTKKDFETLNKINRLDKISYDKIELVIRWCQYDDFWRANILSVNALRRNFRQLYSKAKVAYSKHQQSRTVKI